MTWYEIIATIGGQYGQVGQVGQIADEMMEGFLVLQRLVPLMQSFPVKLARNQYLSLFFFIFIILLA